jgi:hypothetical protein
VRPGWNTVRHGRGRTASGVEHSASRARRTCVQGGTQCVTGATARASGVEHGASVARRTCIRGGTQRATRRRRKPRSLRPSSWDRCGTGSWSRHPEATYLRPAASVCHAPCGEARMKHYRNAAWRRLNSGTSDAMARPRPAGHNSAERDFSSESRPLSREASVHHLQPHAARLHVSPRRGRCARQRAYRRAVDRALDCLGRGREPDHDETALVACRDCVRARDGLRRRAERTRICHRDQFRRWSASTPAWSSVSSRSSPPRICSS